MIGLDTNILIRFLTQDDARQSPIANRIIEQGLTRARPGFINVVTIVEIAWVIESSFDLDRDERAALIDAILRLENVVVQHRNHVLRALDEMRTGGADFSDVLVGALCADAGCETTLTFDKRASRLPGFKLAT
jgi:predicted nucleic-acid-binding protein